jgi:hypothetical protein
MPTPTENGTLLTITPLSGSTALMLTPYSARGLTQALEPITGTSFNENVMGSLIRETINGETINLIPSWMQKYQSTVTCTDQETPCMDNAWLGLIVQVDCAVELNYLTGSGGPYRPVVSGSEREEGHFTFYRPQLIMMITGIRNSFAEWEADYQWQLQMRETQIP